MKKKLYQKPNIKVHDLPMDALLAASPELSDKSQRGWSLKSEDVTEDNPVSINSKRGNLWGDDEE